MIKPTDPPPLSFATPRARDIEPLAALCARAYEAEPQFLWFFPEPERRPRLRSFYRFRLRFGALYGRVRRAGTPSSPSGVVLSTTAAASHPSLWHLWKGGAPRLIREIPFASVRRINWMSAQLQVVRRRLLQPDTPVIEVLAVDESAHGRGIGNRLLGAVLDEVDAAGTPCYLEATRLRNVQWYERHGFRVREELRFGPGDIVWCLTRG